MVIFMVGNGNNMVSCIIIVIIQDSQQGLIVVCQENIIKELDVNGSVIFIVVDIDNGSFFNNCIDFSYSFSQLIFDCDDVGVNIVILIVVDGNGKFSFCISILFIWDNSSLVLLCKDIIIGLDENGIYFLDFIELDNGSLDNCSILFSVFQMDFDCDDLGMIIVVMFYVID